MNDYTNTVLNIIKWINIAYRGWDELHPECLEKPY